MIPCLPQLDPNPEKRKAAIAENQATYEFDFSFHDIGFPKRVPKEDQAGIHYKMKGAELMTDLMANSAGKVTEDVFRELHKFVHEKFKGSDKVDHSDLLSKLSEAFHQSQETYPATLKDFENLYSLIQAPPAKEHFAEDWWFAYERLCGTNPIMLVRVNELSEKVFPFSQSGFEASFKGDSLKQALAENRLYVADWSLLRDLPLGVWGKDHTKHLYAPKALFVQTKDSSEHVGKLMPVAIETRNSNNGNLGVFTPSDGINWQMAKCSVQVADANHHGVVVHLYQFHLIMTHMVLSTYRTLAPNHPIRVLLKPHFEYTLVVAEETKNVISPGGNTQKLQSPSLEGVYQLVKRAHDEFHWQDFSLPQFFQKRGLDDKEGLRDYPYRDDSESIFAATKEFVTSYIKLYYASDADVTGDDELKAWLTELASQDGGRIRGLPNLNGIDDLILFVTQVIDRASTSHAAVNYSVWNALSFAPNMPAAGYASGPVEGKPSKEEDLYKMMPPLNIAKDTVSFTYMVGHFRVNQLGHYPLMNFADHRVMPLIKVFKSALADVENTIKQRNKERPVAYELLLPSNVPASLQV